MELRGAAAARSKLSWGWWHWIGLWTLVGLVIRVAAVLGRARKPLGDAYFYHYAANLLVEGKGFINPYQYNGYHRVVPTASFPPGFIFVLALAALVGFKSFFAQRIWCAIVGAAAVTVCGLAGREIAGRRAGIFAAAIVAVYPNLWMSDEAAMSESLSALLVAVVLLLGFRFWRQPSTRRAAWLGLAIGLAALARDELSLLGLFLFVPLVVTARGLSWKARGRAFAAGTVAAVVLVGPWVGYNMSRFQKPVFISSGLGITLASTNCGQVYYGEHEGYWSMSCALAVPLDLHADESVQGSEAQSWAMHYVRTHEGRLIPVMAARVGREFGLFHPMQQIQLDQHVEGRPFHWALAGLVMFYVLSALSLAGIVILRRRRVPLYPFAAVTAVVLIAVAMSFGDTRYRTPFEVVVVILGSAALDAMVGLIGRREPPLQPSSHATLGVGHRPAAVGAGS